GVGGRSLDVDQRLAVRPVGPRVDVEVVAPQHVLVGRVAAAAVDEVAGVTGEAQGAVVDRVHRDVAAGDVVAVGQTRAAAEQARELAGQRVLQVGDEGRGQRADGQLAGAAREVDVLRERPLRADRVAGVLPQRRGARQDAADQDVGQVDRLDVIAGQVDVEVEDRDRQVGPDHDVGEDGGHRGVVDR